VVGTTSRVSDSYFEIQWNINEQKTDKLQPTIIEIIHSSQTR